MRVPLSKPSKWNAKRREACISARSPEDDGEI
jgi:hypothetical protein